jgi:ribosomal protein L40E
MKSRPSTTFTLALKDRRCPKCGAKLNNQVTRCKRCTKVLTRPKKKAKRKKFRQRQGT